MSNGKLLTIAIPTYNRAPYLDLCLSQIESQIVDFQDKIELIVSNNCSTDDTEAVVNDYIKRGLAIKYVANSENIGADGNFLQCYGLAGGKYVVIFGDDDLFLAGSLARVISILETGDYGLVHINSYGFQNDYLSEVPKTKKSQVTCYTSPSKYLAKVNYWITFASGNIFNKSLLPAGFAPGKFSATSLVQVYWYLSSVFAAKQNVYVSEYLVATKTANTGGYNLCRVFGNNLSLIFDHFVEKGVPARYFDSIKRKLVLSFFPNLILILRSGSPGFNLKIENYYSELKPTFSNYPYFWLVTVPAIKAPVPLARTWMRVVKLFDRLIRR